MNPYRRFFLRILVASYATLVVSMLATNAYGDDGLTLSISIDQSVGGVPTIEFDTPFQVVLKNNSDKEIRISHPLSHEGYYCLTIEAKNLQTGETFLTRKRQVDDLAYFELVSPVSETGSNSIMIAPNEEFTTQVEILDFTAGAQAWTGIPEPNTGDKYSILARYHASVTDSGDTATWSGSISSDPTDVFFASKRVDTPHEYLMFDLPNLALRVMKDDRAWINRREDERQFTPLHVAAQNKHLEVVKWLLDNGADINSQAIYGWTPLHIASDPEVVELILKYSPELNIRNGSRGQTPLQRAAVKLSDPRWIDEQSKWQSIIAMFLAAGAEYDIISAIHLNDLERVKAICSIPMIARVNRYTESPLRLAVSLDRFEICKYLITEQGADVDQFESGNGYPIIVEAMTHPEILRLLIENGADLTFRVSPRGGQSGYEIVGDAASALHFAARDGVPETINILIDAGVDLFATTQESFTDKKIDRTVLEVAAFFGKADNAEAIINHSKFNKISPELRQKMLDRSLIAGVSPGWVLHKPDRPGLLKILLYKGANPNATDENGNTAIAFAARHIDPIQTKLNERNKELITILLEHGGKLDMYSAVAIGDESTVDEILHEQPGSVDSRAHDGYPALHIAVGMDYRKIVDMLLASGANMDIRNESDVSGTKGDTALHCAAYRGHDEVAKRLINAGADINAKNEYQSTPLHIATGMSSFAVIRLLLDNGALIDVKDNAGKTPLDLCQRQHKTVTDALLKVFQEYHDK